MKATTTFLNEIVLIDQGRKLTSQDRAAVRQYLLQRWGRTSPAGRDLLLAAEGVGSKDELLARAWVGRHTKGQPLLQEAITRYRL